MQALAKKIEAMDGELEERLAKGFQLVTSRSPTSAEQKILVALYEQAKQQSEQEQDAYEAVASALLNLDEIMSK